jgi:hypothetical protein
VLETDALANPIEQRNRPNRPHRTAPFGPLIQHESRDSPGLSDAVPSVIWPNPGGNSGRRDLT